MKSLYLGKRKMMNIRQRIIKDAEGWIGTTENPKGSNKTPFGEWYGLDGNAWCAMFVSYIYHFAEKTLPDNIEKPKKNGETYPGFHYVPNIYVWAQKTNRLTNNPQMGDIVIFDWQGDNFYDHTGIFVEWASTEKTKFWSIEGNTSSDMKGSQSNGDGVYKRLRPTSFAKFINVIEP